MDRYNFICEIIDFISLFGFGFVLGLVCMPFVRECKKALKRVKEEKWKDENT